MTNAERFIDDENLIDTFIGEFTEYACKQDWDLAFHNLDYFLREFFKLEIEQPKVEFENKKIEWGGIEEVPIYKNGEARKVGN